MFSLKYLGASQALYIIYAYLINSVSIAFCEN